MNFASDNAAGVAPQIVAALARINTGHVLGYGNDEISLRAIDQFRAFFGRDLAAYLVTTGTAANALALAHLSLPWGAVFCHREAHIATSEAGAPEFFGNGLKLVLLPGENGKITPQGLRAALDGAEWGGPHHVTPSVLSLTQVTEAGTVYKPGEVAELSEIAHANGMSVHMDGARFGNAVASLGITPAELSWKVGVDVLSFGATKGGAMAAEAVIFFDKARAAGMDERRKRAGHLVSKHRFVAQQFAAFLEGGLWLELARHANIMAARLASRLTDVGLKPIWPVEANLVFAILPAEVNARLTAAGASFYARRGFQLPGGAKIPPDGVLARMVTSFATTAEEIDRFAALAAAR
jgi:threonine aldolase